MTGEYDEVRDAIYLAPDGYAIVYGFVNGDNRRGKDGLLVIAYAAHDPAVWLINRYDDQPAAKLVSLLAANHRLGALGYIGTVELFRNGDELKTDPDAKAIDKEFGRSCRSEIVATAMSLFRSKSDPVLVATAWFNPAGNIRLFEVKAHTDEYLNSIGL